MYETRPDFRRLVTSVGVYAVAGVAQQGAGFLLIPVYTRLIDPNEYGVLEMLNVFSSITFALLTLGLGSSINKCYHRDCPSPREKQTVLATAISLAMPMLLCGSTLLLVCARPLSRWLVGSGAAEPLLPLVVGAGLCSSLAALALSSIRAEERALNFSVLTVTQFAASLGLNLLFVVGYRMGIRGILWGNLLSNALLLALSLTQSFHAARFRFNHRLLRPLLSFGLYLIPVLMAAWIMDMSDRYLLRLYRTLDEVAVYGVGYKFGMLIELAVVWPFQLAWPAFSFAISHRAGHQTTYARTLTYLTAASVFAVLGISLLTRAALPKLLGAQYADAYQVVPIVALAYALHGVHYCVSPGIHISGNTRYLTLLAVASGIFNLGFSLLLIPHWGMIGAAWATLLSFLFLAVATGVVAQQTYPVQYEYGRLAKAVALGALVYGIAMAVPPGVSVLARVSATALPLLAFPVLLGLVGFLDETEWMALRRVVRGHVPVMSSTAGT